jgi:phage terminase small subunit
MNLTPKQQRFCEEYMVDLNGTQAAIRAGYSKRTSNEQAVRLLANVSVSAKIFELQKALSKSTGITAERILKEFAKIGFANIQDYISAENEITDLSKIEVDKAAAVESITVTETTFGTPDNPGVKTKVAFKLYDKISALVNMGRHIGLFEKDNRQKDNKVRITVTKK